MLFVVVVNIKPQKSGSERGVAVEGPALINQICSGYVTLMPELKRDQEVRARRSDKRRAKRGGKLRLRLLALPLFPLLCLFVCFALFTDRKLL